jgi:uroporphyrin-III C-methyltransferase/precorrin-2 dehydrogenase/sirohydrochlorin ferrochelatase
MRFLPVFLDLSAGRIVLVGHGGPARAKLHLLRARGANVRWFPQRADITEDVLAESDRPGHLDFTLGEPTEADLSGALAVVSAAGGETDEQVAALARRLDVPVNVVDRPDLSTFIFPAVVDRGHVVVAIGTGGASPVLARRLREKIEAILPARIGNFAGLMDRHRDRLSTARRRRPGLSLRRFWENVIDGPIGAAFLSGHTLDAEAALILAADSAALSPPQKQGVVHLVGAGPGDPDLLTLRALHVLQAADVVFYDELVSAEVLGRARRDAERVFVGKRKGAPGIGQDDINRRLVAAARAGRAVVRLKAGDPFIFGRGGEELEHLRRAGVQALVVPGITAALGCAAEAGLPLTRRGAATRLSLVTANVASEAAGVDWSGLADPHTTVVVYMGLSAAAAVRDGLIAAGRDPRTPAAVLARGTRPDSETAAGCLDDLPRLAAGIGEGPALLVIGDVVAHSLPWTAAYPTPNEVAA